MQVLKISESHSLLSMGYFSSGTDLEIRYITMTNGSALDLIIGFLFSIACPGNTTKLFLQ